VAIQPFRTNCIRFSLRSKRRAVIAFVVALAPVLFLTEETLRTAAATTLAESPSLARIRWSVRLDPSNSRLYHRLGMRSYLAVVASQPAEKVAPSQVIELLQKSLELNPRQSSYWWDLASVCDTLHRPECAATAFKRALELDPMRPRLRWLAANHYLRAGDTDTALAHFRQLLVLDPSYASDTFRICTRILDDPQTVLERILPGNTDPKLKLAYITALMSGCEATAAYQIWTRSVSSFSPLPFDLTEPFLDALINGGHIQEAAAVWSALEKAEAVTRPEGDDQTNSIFNGDFERLPLNAGFDWRYVEGAYVSLDFADATPYHGAQCLRLDFTVSRNEEYEPVYQFIPVLPNHSYILSAYVRSQEITSDSGPRLRVVDPFCGSCLKAASESTVGTTPWHQARLTFATGPATKLVKMSVWRPRGRTYPMTITGAFWLDFVSMRTQAADHQEIAAGR
jgi:tetratricopeptide (TPR) repeat protein